MTIVAIGVDAIDIDRVRRLLRANGARFVDRVFTADERAYCLSRHDPAESLAARFAAKEAVMKCLRTGWAEGIGFTQIEVQRDANGAVSLQLAAAARARADALGVRRWHLSITHTATTATAFAIAEQ